MLWYEERREGLLYLLGHYCYGVAFTMTICEQERAKWEEIPGTYYSLQ